MDERHRSDRGHLQVVEKHPPVLLSFFLKTGHWRHLFEETKCNWIIAKALNDWVEEEEENFRESKIISFELVGYLITGRKLGLVLKIKKKELRPALRRFYEFLNERIADNLKNREEELQDVLNDDTSSNVQFHNLFEKKMPMSPYLVKLITGREVRIPYYDPHLARLEKNIRHYNFCSAIDYSQAIGPVKIKLFSKEELDRLERTTDD